MGMMQWPWNSWGTVTSWTWGLGRGGGSRAPHVMPGPGWGGGPFFFLPLHSWALCPLQRASLGDPISRTPLLAFGAPITTWPRAPQETSPHQTVIYCLRALWQDFPPSWFSPQEQDLPLPRPSSSHPLACRLQLPSEDTSAKTPLGTSGLHNCSVPEDPRDQLLWLAHELAIVEHSSGLEDSWCWAQVWEII